MHVDRREHIHSRWPTFAGRRCVEGEPQPQRYGARHRSLVLFARDQRRTTPPRSPRERGRGVRAHGSSLPRVSWLWLTKPYLGLTQAEVRVHAKPKGSQPQAPEPIGLATLTNATANHPARVSSQASSHRLGLRARSSAHSQSLKREGAQQVRPPRPRSVVVKRQSASQSENWLRKFCDCLSGGRPDERRDRHVLPTSFSQRRSKDPT